jgi:hypothetical protein
MKIRYAAHTATCTLLLDADGICRRICMVPKGERPAKSQGSEAAAERCLGAQYVASLDSRAPGGLIELPKVGMPMIFAKLAQNGRISLVRTGPLRALESASETSQGSGLRTRPVASAWDDVPTQSMPTLAGMARRTVGSYDDESTGDYQVPMPKPPRVETRPATRPNAMFPPDLPRARVFVRRVF